MSVGVGLFCGACALAGYATTGYRVDVTTDPERDDAMVSGVVTNRTTDEPVEDAFVILECTCLEGSREAYTNANGLFVLKGLPPGEYTMMVAVGSWSNVWEARLGAGDNYRVRVRDSMEPHVVT